MVFTLFSASWQMAAATSCYIMVAFTFMKQIALEEKSMKLKTWVQMPGVALALWLQTSCLTSLHMGSLSDLPGEGLWEDTASRVKQTTNYLTNVSTDYRCTIVAFYIKQPELYKSGAVDKNKYRLTLFLHSTRVEPLLSIGPCPKCQWWSSHSGAGKARVSHHTMWLLRHGGWSRDQRGRASWSTEEGGLRRKTRAPQGRAEEAQTEGSGVWAPQFSSCPAHSPGEDTAHCCEILSPVSQGCISLWQPCLPILLMTSRQNTFSDWISNRALCHEVMLQFPSHDVRKKPKCLETKELGSNPAYLGYFRGPVRLSPQALLIVANGRVSFFVAE